MSFDRLTNSNRSKPSLCNPGNEDARCFASSASPGGESTPFPKSVGTLQQLPASGESFGSLFVLRVPEGRYRTMGSDFLQPRRSSRRSSPPRVLHDTTAMPLSPSFAELDAATRNFQTGLDAVNSGFRTINTPEQSVSSSQEEQSPSPIQLAMKPVDSMFDVQAISTDCTRARKRPWTSISPGSLTTESSREVIVSTFLGTQPVHHEVTANSTPRDTISELASALPIIPQFGPTPMEEER